MRMHKKFSRWKGAVPSGGVALGFDGGAGVPPTDPPTQDKDNVLIASFANSAGFPVHRLAVAYKGPAAAIALAAQIWLYDHLTEAWYESGAPQNITPNRINFFDVVSLGEPVQVGPGVKAAAGSISAALVVQDGATPNGEYVFAMGPDLTVLPL